MENINIIKLESKKDFINKLYEQNFKFNNPAQANTQSNLLDKISFDIYTYSKRFLIEILQNCDDSSFEYKNSSLDMAVTINKDIMIISHKGKGFDEMDINSICSAGNSTKGDNKKATGYKGIGFKSVFAVSNKVLILSNGYNFKFDRDYFTKEKCWQDEWNESDLDSGNLKIEVKKPWQIIPIWVDIDELDDFIQSTCKDYEVNFVFYLKNKFILDETKSALTELFEKNPMNILFLKSKEIFITYNEDKKLKVKISKKLLENGVIDIKKDKKSIGLFFIENFSIDIKDFIDKKTHEIIKIDETFPDKLKYTDFIDISFACQILKVKSNYEAHPIDPEESFIYSYLPTLENFDLPFIVNSNFLLDAGRIKLKEHIWNTLIFKHLPNFFLKFYQIILTNFGNSFVNILVDKNIDDDNYFLKDYYTSMEKSIKLLRSNKGNKLLFKTKQGNIQPFNQCYIEQFEINGFKNISDLFTHIFGVNGGNILEEYFSQSSSSNSNNSKIKFKFQPEFEVDKNELDKIELITQYYKIEFKIIAENDFLNFLASDVYKKYTDSDSLLKICSLYKNNFEEIKNIPIFFDEDKKFLAGNNLKFSNSNEDIENLQLNNINIDTSSDMNVKKGKNKITKKKNFAKSQIQFKTLNSKIFETFSSNKEINLLKKFDIEFINTDEWPFIYKRILKDYEEVNTIERINEAFRIWLSSEKSVNNTITEDLKKVKFLTKSERFLNYQCINIGVFYRANERPNKFDKYYEEYSLSEKYFISKNNKKEYYDFFKEIGLLYKEENVLSMKLSFPLEILPEFPYYDEDYKDYLMLNIKKNTTDLELIIYPFLKFYKVEDPKQYKDYLLKIIEERTNNQIKLTPRIDDYLLYTVKKIDLFPTNKLNLIPIKKVNSPDITKNMIDEGNKLMYEVFEFPDNELQNHFNQLEFKKDLSAEDYPLILDRVVLEIKSLYLQDQRKLKIIGFFKFLFDGLIKRDKDFTYNGLFLNSDEEFQKADELYYIIDERKKNLLINTIEKLKLKELLLINKSESFFHFCKKNKVRIYDKNSISYEANNTKEVTFLQEKLIQHQKVLEEIIQLYNQNSSSSKIPKLTINKLKLLRFFSCEEIIIKTDPYQDIIKGVPSYYIKDAENNFNIFYEENDVYKWNHSTIIYFITYNISIFLKCEPIQSELISILLSNDFQDVEILRKFISKSE